jgi:hypothetical protein
MATSHGDRARRVALAGGTALAAGLGGTVSASAGVVGTLVPYLIAALTAAPAAATVLLLVSAQEVSATRHGFENSWGATFGSQLFYTGIGGIPAVVLVTSVAAVSGTYWLCSRAKGAKYLRWAALLTALVALTTIVGIYHGVDPVAVLYRHCSFLLILQGFLIAASLRRQPGGVHGVQVVALAAIGILAVVVLLVIRGSGIGVGIFYDSATPAVAGALALALLRTGGFTSWHRAAVLSVSVAILLVSLRRNIWLAVLSAIILVFACSRGRGRYATRVGAAAIVAVVSVQAFFPAVTAAVVDRLVAADLLNGFDSRDASTADHFEDISVGFDLATAQPWLGYGPDRGLPGLVVQSTLYVHNDGLMAWLAFGVIGLLAYCLTMALGVLVALKVLNNRTTLTESAAAFFLIITPLAGTSAGFVMGTYRWPVLYGICLGISAAALARTSTPVPDRKGVLDGTGSDRQSRADGQLAGGGAVLSPAGRGPAGGGDGRAGG